MVEDSEAKATTRTLRRLGQGLLALLSLLGVAFAYTAWPPYEVPERRFVEPPREFTPSTARREGTDTLILLVLDGFAPATLAAANTPHLDRMGREGASTRDMWPVFPSLSMPNHFSMSTGCYPARHGIVANAFRDRERGFYAATGDADWILECEPLHVVAERQGVRSAVIDWVANSSGTRGKLASVAEPYRKPSKSAEQSIDRVLQLLSSDTPPGYIAAYSTQPDHTGHAHGPLGPETLAMAEALDAQIGRLMAAIEARGLRDRITLVVASDHGMVDAKGMLDVDGIVRRAGVDALVVAERTIALLYLDDSTSKAEAKAALSGAALYDLIDPEDPPAYAHLGTSQRVGDLVIAAHDGYWMADVAHWPWYLRWSSYVGGDVVHVAHYEAMHGYDPARVPGVRAIFYAWGPRIRAGLRIAEMRSIDVHPTLALLLGIEPGAPLDGVARSEIVTLRAGEETSHAGAHARPSP